MQYWLIKSEPDAYGWDDLITEHDDQREHDGQSNNFTQKQFNDGLRDIISTERQVLRSGERALNKNARPGAK